MNRSGKQDNSVASASETIKATMVEVRLRAGLTQADMAAMMATKESAITRIEGGRTAPNLMILAKWAEVTGAQLDIRLT